ncbi:unnamed protein product [Durusdinium trenchii]|uniref:C2H2-type domain-containing protein n=1 Tax=Durusdinium trenchii TaxID=1381693 RepID=A0ABP0I2C0_9DINO
MEFPFAMITYANKEDLVAAEAGRDEVRVQAKKENGMTSMRSNSVDLSKIMIPSPPRGALDHEDVMGKPVWLKIRLSRDDGSHDWIMCMGELAGYTPGGVRGDRKLEIYVKRETPEQYAGHQEEAPYFGAQGTVLATSKGRYGLAGQRKQSWEDEAKQKVEREALMESEVTGEGIIEACVTATSSGQTQQEVYVHKNCVKQNDQVEIAIKILKEMNGIARPDTKASVKQLDTALERPNALDKKNQSSPEKLFPVHYGGKAEDGNLSRPAENSLNVPLIANDGIVWQLFGLGGKLDDTLAPEQVKDLLTHAGLPKIYAGDVELLQKRFLKTFKLHVSCLIDIRTQAYGVEKKGLVKSLEKISSEGTEHVAQRAFVSLLALQDPKPVGATLEKLGQAEKAKAGNEQVKLKPEWQEQRILWSPDGFFCWLCQAGPSPEANMQQHVESAQHQRKLVLAGLKEDHKILPPVPKDYEERGITISPSSDGTLQYTCKLCKAGPFSTLESVKSHLGGSKHSSKEGREPDLQLTPELIKEGFLLEEGEDGASVARCARCDAGPFKDRQSLRQHRLSMQHREVEVDAEMEEQLGYLPGYVQLIGNTFCCYICDVSSCTLDGMLQHLSGKSHRKTCVLLEQPEPIILCKELVPAEVLRSYPLQGRLRHAQTLEPIWRQDAQRWAAEGPQKAPKGPSVQGPQLPRAMVAKEDVCSDPEAELMGAKCGEKFTVLAEEDDKVWAAREGGGEGWMLKSQLVKKLPPWKLKGKPSKEPPPLRRMVATRAVEAGRGLLSLVEGQEATWVSDGG